MVGDTVQCCYREQLKYTLYSALCEPKLYRMAVNGQWDRIPLRCDSHPKEATFVHKYSPYDTALHRILGVVLNEEYDEYHHSLKRSAASAVLKAHPAALAIANTFGRTPLHLACMDAHDGPELISNFIVDGYPGACSMRDVEQRTPLHHWCSVLHIHNNVEMVQNVTFMLVEQYPDALLATDLTGETPRDIAIRRGGKQLSPEIQAMLQPKSNTDN